MLANVFFLSEMDRHRFEQRALWSAMSEPAREGHIRLYNKNASTTLHVRIVKKSSNRYGWIVECDDVPQYFRAVLRPEEAIAP